jgi:hypothetical protein
LNDADEEEHIQIKDELVDEELVEDIYDDDVPVEEEP